VSAAGERKHMRVIGPHGLEQADAEQQRNQKVAAFQALSARILGTEMACG
jgi:hypothetical protein